MCQEHGLCGSLERAHSSFWLGCVVCRCANLLRAGHCADLVPTGDVNLAEEQVRGKHNPGAGGWPTIKYFNKETGYEGGTYVKKDAGAAMCDELGNVDNMEVRSQLSSRLRHLRKGLRLFPQDILQISLELRGAMQLPQS
jgi:hypothetical protein